MPQLFARPRTPNDNPFIESAFSTVKRAPDYPGQFLDDAPARDYFEQYFDWYNHRHYHSGIDHVTPQQAHSGQRGEIVERRLNEHHAQRHDAALPISIRSSIRNIQTSPPLPPLL